MALELKNVSTFYKFTPKSPSNDLEVTLVVGEQNKQEVCYAIFGSRKRYPLTKEVKGDTTHLNAKYSWNLSESVKCNDGHPMPATFLANSVKRTLTSGYHNLMSCEVKGCKTPDSLREEMGQLTATNRGLSSPDGQLMRWIDFTVISDSYKEDTSENQSVDKPK